MRQYIMSKYLIVTAALAVVIIICLSWMSRDGAAQTNGASDDGVRTVGQCINHHTDAPMDPLDEKILIEEGIIEKQLSNTTITNEVCGEILARTPHGSPMERLIAADSVIQEIDVIQKSMKEAVEGDVNGDGVVNVQDTRVASSASFVASHTAQKTIRTAIDEEVGQIGVIEEINAVPAA